MLRLIHGFTGMPVNHATATNVYNCFRIWMCLIATVAAAAAPPFKTVERHVSGTYSNSLAFQVARGVLRHMRAADSVCIFSKPPSYAFASSRSRSLSPVILVGSSLRMGAREAKDEERNVVQHKNDAQGRAFGGYNAAGLPEVQLNAEKWSRDYNREDREGEYREGRDSTLQHRVGNSYSSNNGYINNARDNWRDTTGYKERQRERTGGTDREKESEDYDASTELKPYPRYEESTAGTEGEASISSGVEVAGGAGGWARVKQDATGSGSSSSSVVRGEAAGPLVMLVPIKLMVFVDGTWLYYRHTVELYYYNADEPHATIYLAASCYDISSGLMHLAFLQPFLARAHAMPNNKALRHGLVAGQAHSVATGAAVHVSSYYYMCVLILLCPHTTICVSSYYYTC